MNQSWAGNITAAWHVGVLVEPDAEGQRSSLTGEHSALVADTSLVNIKVSVLLFPGLLLDVF